MSGIIDRIRNLLGAGIQPEVVATTVGCDASYISQLMADENFRSQVVELKTKALLSNTLRDQQWDEIEDALLVKFKTIVPMMLQPNMLLKALQVVNGAKRRGVAPQETTVINNTVINLNIPQQKLIALQKNSRGEIIEIGDRPLATLPSNIAASLAAALQIGATHEQANRTSQEAATNSG